MAKISISPLYQNQFHIVWILGQATVIFVLVIMVRSLQQQLADLFKLMGGDCAMEEVFANRNERFRLQ